MRFPFSAGATRLLFLALLGSASLLPTACKDKETEAPEPAKDYSAEHEALIQKYLVDNGITTAVRQPTGLYFVPVRTDATAFMPRKNDIVYVKYKGTLLDGTVFDETPASGEPFQFVLGAGRVITGWDQGIALMRKGEKAVLLIPSALGYGNRAQTKIPANSVLRFDVDLTEVR